MKAPVFNLNASNVNFDDASLQAELDKKTSKYFDEPGNYDLVISAAEYHIGKDTGTSACKGDDTWHNVKITFSHVDGRSINHWLQIPTAKVTYGDKETLNPYRKFQQFLFGLGESVQIAQLQGLLTKYFADPNKLVGQKVNVDLGYEGPYVERNSEGAFNIIVKGQALSEDGVAVALPDRASAVQYAKGQGIEPSFLRITKFTVRKPSAVKKVASDW